MKIEDALLLAGGLTNNADFKKIIVLRLPKNTADTIATKVLDEYTLSVTPNLKSKDSLFSLRAKDKIIVTSFLNNQSVGNVKIAGEILYPGNYPIEDREETAMDILKRAGGLTPFGNMAQIKIYRSGILVGLNFGENTYRISANDSLYIPKTEPLVEVSGAVSNQQFVLYSSNKLKYYISTAGGITNKASLKKSYVQYANGLNKRTKRFLFFRSYPTIKPGSKIVVPAVESSMAKLMSTNNVSAILTSLTALISLIVLLKK
jgi:protein involved in polysaccharide export with SLBB domain